MTLLGFSRCFYCVDDVIDCVVILFDLFEYYLFFSFMDIVSRVSDLFVCLGLREMRLPIGFVLIVG